MVVKNNKEEILPQRLLTVAEVAYMLHIHNNTVRLWSKIGVLKSYRIGRRGDYRFDIDDVKTFLNKNKYNLVRMKEPIE